MTDVRKLSEEVIESRGRKLQQMPEEMPGNREPWNLNTVICANS